MKTKTMILCSLFTALIIVGRFLILPIGTIPVTLQTLFVVLAALILRFRGILPVILYICIGLIGFPVFSFGGGIGSFYAMTFGFVLGFLPGVLVVATISKQNSSFVRCFIASVSGVVIIYIFGYGYMFLLFGGSLDIGKTLSTFPVLFAGDIAKCIIATVVAVRLRKITNIKI